MRTAKVCFMAAVAGCAIVGCSSPAPNPGGSPAAKIIPDSISLNIDEFPEDGNSDTSRLMLDMPGSGHGRFCVMGPTIVHRFQRLTDAGLELAAGIKEDVADLQGTTLAGTLTVRGTEVAYKADFAAFDIDADGTADGSGTTDTAPAALRLWVDMNGTGEFEPVLCALITTLPDDTQDGAGQLYIHPHVLNPSANADFVARITWDHSDAANRWNEGYFKGTLRGGYRMSGSHARVESKTLDDASVEKTVRNTGTLLNDPHGIGEMRYASRTIEGLGSGLMSVEAIGSGFDAEFNVCTSFENCSMHPGNCSAIDPAGMDFLAAPVGTETDWPAAFPASPTF